jgi:NTP pyrophosphatase (non-canonical NTP hydrolase)
LGEGTTSGFEDTISPYVWSTIPVLRSCTIKWGSDFVAAIHPELGEVVVNFDEFEDPTKGDVVTALIERLEEALAEKNPLKVMETRTPLNDLAKEIHDTAVEKGWWESERNVGEALMLMVSEVAEALEEWRGGSPINHTYYREHGDRLKPEGVPIELADVIIRVLDFAAAHDIDMDTALKEKMDYNLTREYRHGGKLA